MKRLLFLLLCFVPMVTLAEASSIHVDDLDLILASEKTGSDGSPKIQTIGHYETELPIIGLFPFQESCLAWTYHKLELVSADGDSTLISSCGPGEQIHQAWYEKGLVHYIYSSDDPKQIKLISGGKEIAIDMPGLSNRDPGVTGFKLSYNSRCDLGVVLDEPLMQIWGVSFLAGDEPRLLRENTYASYSFEISPDCSSFLWCNAGNAFVKPRPPASMVVARLAENKDIVNRSATSRSARALYSDTGKHIISWEYDGGSAPVAPFRVTISDANAKLVREVEFDRIISVAQYIDSLDLLVAGRQDGVELVTADGRRFVVPVSGIVQATTLEPDTNRIWYATREDGVRVAELDPNFIQPEGRRTQLQGIIRGNDHR